MLQGFGIARQLDMDDEAERGNIDTARSHVSRHANPCSLVAQRLQRIVTLVLAVLARQRHSGKTALDQAGVKVADIITCGAKQHRGFGFVKAQQVDHRMFDVRRRDRHRLIGNINMALRIIDRGNAQGVLLIALGQCDDGLGHGCRKHHGAPRCWRRIEDFLKVITKAHVEHLVCLIEHGKLQRRQVKRAALEMIAQAARCADDDMRALIERAALFRWVHTANTSGDAGVERGEQPLKLTADLQSQFARRRDHQRQRGAGSGQGFRFGQQLHADGEAEGNGLARAGARRNDQIAIERARLDNRRLDRSRRGIALGRNGLGKRGR